MMYVHIGIRGLLRKKNEPACLLMGDVALKTSLFGILDDRFSIHPSSITTYRVKRSIVSLEPIAGITRQGKTVDRMSLNCKMIDFAIIKSKMI